ncbi:uncharacterized protein N7487_001767 [Penicillium crustosum]|uniref:uncharacterized protein n=1 Tax=Penicillium crustosum TaxID=36656 RepID=UPI00238D300A|nr:uncharacterized protein N7487_001767 [Penicillium crustosum]KAJ5418217.1 hypothetical protein N7487_001767 [Penicillium crustosum]
MEACNIGVLLEETHILSRLTACRDLPFESVRYWRNTFVVQLVYIPAENPFNREIWKHHSPRKALGEWGCLLFFLLVLPGLLLLTLLLLTLLLLTLLVYIFLVYIFLVLFLVLFLALISSPLAWFIVHVTHLLVKQLFPPFLLVKLIIIIIIRLVDGKLLEAIWAEVEGVPIRHAPF